MPNNKLKLDDIKIRLRDISPSISILSTEYVGNMNKLKCKCSICGHEWDARWSSLNQGYGCPNCAILDRNNTLEYVMGELSKFKKTVTIDFSSYKNNKSKLKCICNVCGHSWNSSFNAMSRKESSGCAKCEKIAPYTLDYVIGKIDDEYHNIKYINGDYINSRSPIIVECNECGFNWTTNWSNIQSGRGCPKCAGKLKYTLPQIKEMLYKINKNITILSSEYTTVSKKLECKCEECGDTLYIRWGDLKRGIGCKKCISKKNGDDKRITVDEINKKISSLGLQMFALEYNSAKEGVLCQCTECKTKWRTTSNGILNSKTSCPTCHVRAGWRRSGWVNAGKKSKNFTSFQLYILECYNNEEMFYKIGITFLDILQRYRTKESMPYDYKIIRIIKSEDGEYIWNLEKSLHKAHRDKTLSYIPSIYFQGSATECFSDLLNIDELIKK